MTKLIPNNQQKVGEDAAIRNKTSDAIDSPAPLNTTQTVARLDVME